MKRRGSWEATDSVPWTAFGDALHLDLSTPAAAFRKASLAAVHCVLVMSHMLVFLMVTRTQVFERIDITITQNHYVQRT